MQVDYSADDGVTLASLFRSLWAKKLWVIIPVIFVSAAVLAILMSITPQYSSTASILVEDRQSIFSRPKGETVLQARPDELAVASHVQLLLSNDLAHRVAADQALADIPEFNSDGKNAGYLKQFMIMIGLVRVTSDERIEETIVRGIAKRLSVYQVRNSRVIDIEFSSSDPLLAARVANSLADEYIEMQREQKRRSTREAASWLEEQIDQLRNKVETAEAAVESYRSAHGLLLGSDKTTLSSQQLTGLTRELVAAKTARAEAQARAQLIRETLNSGGDLSAASDVLKSTLVQRIQEQQVTLQRRLAELSVTMLPSHPRMREVSADLANLKRQIRIEAEKVVLGLESEARIAGARENALRASLNSLSQESERQNEQSVEVRSLEREAKAQRDLLESFLGQFREATARADLQELPTEARIVSRASASSRPSFPKKLPVLLITIFATTFLALGILVSFELITFTGLPEASRQGVVEPVIQGDVGQPPETPPVADVADANFAVEAPHKNVDKDLTNDETLHAGPNLDAREAVKRIARLVRAKKIMGEGVRIFVCAPQRHNANNHAAVNLARQLSQEGERVVLIDANLQAPRIAQQTGVDYHPGFTDLLIGHASFVQVLQRDPDSRLHVITAGGESVDMMTLLSTNRLEQVLDALEGTYTFVIIDGPPAMSSSEASALAANSDIAVIVPDTLPGTQRLVLRAKDVLTDHGRQPVEVLTAGPAIGDRIDGRDAGTIMSAV